MGDINKGGAHVHYRDGFRRCCWAFVVSGEAGNMMNLKQIPEGADQWIWRPKIKYGAGKDCWHLPDECGLDDAGLKAKRSKTSAPAGGTK
mgnify:CR=1 FL=1